MKPIEAHSTATIKAKVTREEQAAQELGHTDFAHGTRSVLIAFFLLVILSVPLIQLYAALHRPERVTRLISGLRGLAPNPEQIHAVDGVMSAVNLLPTESQIKRVEDDWEQVSVVGEALLPRVQSLLLELGHGNEKAYLGKNGWLYYRSDMDFITGRGFLEPAALKRRAASGHSNVPQPDPIKAIVHFRDQLAARGIALIVMPAPAKPSIYPEYYADGFGGKCQAVLNASYDQFKSRLSKEGVALFDPTHALLEEKERSPGTPLYLKTDTHWTTGTMERMAVLLAANVRNTIVLAPALTGRFTTSEKPISNLGDVAMMLKLPKGQTTFPPETVQIKQVLDGRNLWKPNTHSEVLFLGDSFANIYSLEPMGWGEAAGFVEHLSLALGLPLDSICRNDAGSHATREMLAKELQRGNDRLAGKKVVIWEFAARELASGDWKLTPMVLGEKKTVGFYAPPDNQTVEVKAVVRAASPAPRPGSVPYKDHILTLHLTDIVSSNDPSANGKEAVVFAWSMRDNITMPASRYRSGETVQLRLQAWSDVASKYEKINRSELNDEKFLLADAAWSGEPGLEKAEGSLPIAGLQPSQEEIPAKAVASNPDSNAPIVAKNDAEDFRQHCAKLAANGDAMAVHGKDGWLFVRSELRHIGVGRFWGEAAAKVSKATSADKADPLPAILDFNDQLKAMGIELILAPTPCKALIYPEMLEGHPVERLDAVHQQFINVLREKGVNVLDLTEFYLKEKSKPGTPLLYCKTDSHWSPYACEVTAKKLAEIMGSPPWLKSNRDAFKIKLATRTITGDLTDGKDSEELPIRLVEAPGRSVEDKASPVVLLGDSHLLVFHSGADMHGTGAGLSDQLAAELGIPIDVVAVRGSGATPARVNLMRRARADPSYLTGKKVVVWCFTTREFTESTGWSVFKLSK